MDMDPAKLNVEYEIIDTENPENNQTISADTASAPQLTKEERLERIAALARMALVEKILKRRDAEASRALKGRVKARRIKDKAAKASRKRNRK